jgi:hypothetical protein
MAVTAEVNNKITSRQTAPGDYGGGITTETGSLGIRLGSGTGDYKVNKRFMDVRTLAIGATEDLDLKTLTDDAGVALDLDEVRLIRIEAAVGNAANIEVKPGAANGWAGATGWLKDPSDIKPIPPGSATQDENFQDGSNVVDATHKVLTVTNMSGAATATYTITIFGCT